MQKVLLEEGKKAGDEMTRLTLELQNDYVDKFKAAGVTFVDDVDTRRLPEVDRAASTRRSRSGRRACTTP